jgi:cytochrome c553
MNQKLRQKNARSALYALALGLSALVASGGLISAGTSKGDKAFGEYLSAECVTCHQKSGRVVGGIPAIVGWPEDQFIAVMMSYHQGHRENQVMRSIAGKLKADEIEALAAYFGSLKPQR